MESGEGDEPWNSIYGSISFVRGRLDNWNWGPPTPLPYGRGAEASKASRFLRGAKPKTCSPSMCVVFVVSVFQLMSESSRAGC